MILLNKKNNKMYSHLSKLPAEILENIYRIVHTSDYLNVMEEISKLSYFCENNMSIRKQLIQTNKQYYHPFDLQPHYYSHLQKYTKYELCECPHLPTWLIVHHSKTPVYPPAYTNYSGRGRNIQYVIY